MAYLKPCPRTLDRPITIFGLEPEELVLVGMVAGAVLFLIDAVPAVLMGAGLWIGLSRVKAGKPPGHLHELAYRSGAFRWIPGSFRAPHLIPRDIRILDAFEGEDTRAIETYWAGRPRLGS